MRYLADRSSSTFVARTALLAAAASVLGYAETVLLPVLPVPGMRVGIANLAVVIALVLVGSYGALIVSIARVLIVGMATGSLLGPASLLALAGAVVAWGAMVLAIRLGRGAFSVIGVSLAGSFAHVIAQLVVASLLVGTLHPLALAPVSLAAALCAGAAIGYSAHLLLSRVPFTKVSFA